eukprot:840183-Pyramimonas_sp.AAC.1
MAQSCAVSRLDFARPLFADARLGWIHTRAGWIHTRAGWICAYAGSRGGETGAPGAQRPARKVRP